MSDLTSTQRRAKVRKESLDDLIAANKRPSMVPLDEVVDLIGLLILGLIALTGMAPVFGGTRYLVVGGIGLMGGLLIAWLFAHFGKPLWLMLLTTLGFFVVLGPCLTQPDATFSLVVPSLTSVVDTATGSVQGWANLLTTTTPVGAAQDLLLVPWVSGVVAGAASMWLARRRTGASLLAILPLLAVLVAGIIVGIDEPSWMLQASVFIGVALLWGSVRQRMNRAAAIPGGRQFRLGGAIGLVVVAGLSGLVLGQWSLVRGPNERLVVRDEVDPPVDLRNVPSPLEGFRFYRKTQPTDVAFKVEGLEKGDLIRLATLDDYDGVVWHVRGGDTASSSSSLFQRVGETIPVDAVGEQRSIDIEVVDYDGPWVPTLGPVEKVVFAGDRGSELSEEFRYNLATDTAAIPEGLQAGDRFTLDVVDPGLKLDVTEGVPDPLVPLSDPFPIDLIAKQAVELLPSGAADASPLEKARAISERFRKGLAPDDPRRGYFSDGYDKEKGHRASLAGHGVERTESMLDVEQSPYIIGDEEQYASAMALLASEVGGLNFPVRVVVGFKPEVNEGGTTEVRNEQITAWTEVAVKGHGWVPLFPTPTETNVPDKEPTLVPPPDRLVLPPREVVERVTPPRSGRGGGEPCTEDCGEEGGSSSALLGVVRVAGIVALPPLLLIGGVTALMAGLKLRRRKIRRRKGLPAERIAGGWDDVCDLAVDLGDVVPSRATRRESAVVLARPGIAPLAKAADSLAFGPEPVDEPAVERYWHEVDTTRAAMLAPMSRFQRWKALVNPSSLRRRNRLKKAPLAGAGTKPSKVAELRAATGRRVSSLKGSTS